MLASGTLTQLRNEYGGFYRIRATCISGTSEDEVAVLLRTHFGDEMSDLIVRYGHVTFRLPHETRKMGYIMKTMEGMKVVAVERDQDNLESERNVDDGTSSRVEATTRVFEDYTVTGPTMDEVFMNVCRKAKLDPM